MRQFRKHIRAILIKTVLKIKRFDHREVIIVLGSPRSGTSWISEVLANKTNAVANTELLDARRGVFETKFNLGWNPKYGDVHNLTEFIQFFKKAISLRKYSEWTLSQVGLQKLIRSSNVVTKFVIGHKLTPYLLPHLDLKYKMIHIIRDPLDTVYSQLKVIHKLNNEEMFKKFSKKIDLSEFEDNKYASKAQNMFELYLIKWFNDNLGVINQRFNHYIIPVSYEKMLDNPEIEFNLLLTEIGYNQPLKKLNSLDYQKPSWSDYRQTFKSRDRDNNFRSITNKISKSNIENIKNIYNYYDLYELISINEKYACPFK